MQPTPPSPPTSIQPDGWARPRGYSNGVVAEGRLLLVAARVEIEATAVLR